MSYDGSGRIYVGNLPDSCTEDDLKRLFKKYGKVLKYHIKQSSAGLPYGFVEFRERRDAKDAVRGRDGYEFNGYRLRVEFPFKSLRATNRKVDFRYFVEITGLPDSVSWQELKDYLSIRGLRSHVNVFRDGKAEVAFCSRDDMECAIDKYDGSNFRSRNGDKNKIRIKEKVKSWRDSDGRRRYSRERRRHRSRSSSSRCSTHRYSNDYRNTSRKEDKRRSRSVSHSRR